MILSLANSTLLVLVVLFFFFFLPVHAQGRCGVSPCKGGCYDSNDNGVCETVPAGHYSPLAEDRMFPCAAGSYSDTGARQCTLCEPGHATNAIQAKLCPACRPGEYAPALGSTVCLKCKTKYYLGFGSYAIFYDGVDWYCLPPEATESPTTSSPTISLAPTMTKMPSAPSTAPSATRNSTAVPSLDSSIKGTTRSPIAAPQTVPPTVPPTFDDSALRPTPWRKLFWKFVFPCVMVVVVLSLALCVFLLVVKKKRAPTSPKGPLSPTTTLGSKTLGQGGTIGVNDSGFDFDDDSFVLNDLYGEDIPKKNKKFFADEESASDVYFDDMSVVDSTADDYSLKF